MFIYSCKYYVAPATAACGHTLCLTCWRGRRTCPTCSQQLDRKSLKLNVPLQTLKDHVQVLGEAFEKLTKSKSSLASRLILLFRFRIYE